MAEEKRRGRPPLPAGMKKGGNLTFRARASVREQLEVAASRNDRSISEEIEHRLLASFEAEGLTDLIERLVRERLG